MKSIIVFGGSGLIGSQIVNLFLKNSYSVINFDIENKLQSKKNYKYEYCDLSLISNVQELFNIVEKYMNGCVSLINSSLIPYPDFNIKSLSKSEITHACSSLFALDFFICSLAINYAVEKSPNKNLSVILTSSVKALYPPKFRHYKDVKGMSSSPFYGSMKAASLMLIKHFASSYRDLNVTFNAIAPGGINGEKHEEAFLKRYRESTSNVGLIDPTFIALAAKYIVESGPYLNGTSITVDSGWSCD